MHRFNSPPGWLGVARSRRFKLRYAGSGGNHDRHGHDGTAAVTKAGPTVRLTVVRPAPVVRTTDALYRLPDLDQAGAVRRDAGRGPAVGEVAQVAAAHQIADVPGAAGPDIAPVDPDARR